MARRPKRKNVDGDDKAELSNDIAELKKAVAELNAKLDRLASERR